MKRIIALILAVALLLISGCAAKLEKFSDSNTLSPVDQEGIVVIAYESDTAIHSLIFSGPGKFELEHTLYDKEHNYVVTRMPAGTYDIKQVRIFNKYNYITLGSSEDENWEVTIEKNKINYIGDFSLDNIGAGFKVQIKNNSTLALEFLKENYSNIYDSYPLVYGKDGPEDHFFEYVSELEGE